MPAITPRDKKAKFRVLYASTTLQDPWDMPSDQSYYVLYYRASYGSALSVSKENQSYPYAGCFNSPQEFGVAGTDWESINFGDLAFKDPYIGTSQPTQTLQTLYWANTLAQIAKGRLLTAKFDMTAEDMEYLRLNPNMKIWVNNKYWRANKVTFEGNDNLRGLTTMELVSIEEGLVINVEPTGGGSTGGGGGNINLGFGGSGMIVGTTNNVSSAQKYIVNGEHNIITEDTYNVSLNGDRYYVGRGSRNVTITGSDVRVTGSNVTIINTNNINVVSDNITIIDNVLYVDGQATVLHNLIEGGSDELRSAAGGVGTNLVDGGVDSNANPFSQSTIKTIDSDTGQNGTI